MRLGQPDLANFAGAVHDSDLLNLPWLVQPEASRALAHRKDFWVVGTAVLLRATALREVGLLEELYFAYYEDVDICARLAAAHWHSAMAYDTHVEHACLKGQMFERPPYYFYLMVRNAFRSSATPAYSASGTACWAATARPACSSVGRPSAPGLARAAAAEPPTPNAPTEHLMQIPSGKRSSGRNAGR